MGVHGRRCRIVRSRRRGTHRGGQQELHGSLYPGRSRRPTPRERRLRGRPEDRSRGHQDLLRRTGRGRCRRLRRVHGHHRRGDQGHRWRADASETRRRPCTRRRRNARRLRIQQYLRPGGTTPGRPAPGARQNLRPPAASGSAHGGLPRIPRTTGWLAGAATSLRHRRDTRRHRACAGLRSTRRRRYRLDGRLFHGRRIETLRAHGPRGRPGILPGIQGRSPRAGRPRTPCKSRASSCRRNAQRRRDARPERRRRVRREVHRVDRGLLPGRQGPPGNQRRGGCRVVPGQPGCAADPEHGPASVSGRRGGAAGDTGRRGSGARHLQAALVRPGRRLHRGP